MKNSALPPFLSFASQNEVLLKVKVQPKSSQAGKIEIKGDELKIFLASAPEKGKANQELLKIMAKILAVPRANLSIIRGLQSRSKQINISGLSIQEIQKKIQQSMSDKKQ